MIGIINETDEDTIFFCIIPLRINFILLHILIFILFLLLISLIALYRATSNSLERDGITIPHDWNSKTKSREIQFVDDNTFHEVDFCFASANKNA